MIRARRLPSANWPLVGLGLLALLSLPAARRAMESSMSLHMLVQFPLLALCGYLLAAALPVGSRARIDRWNCYGLAGLFGTAMVLAVVMIPRVLDLALVNGRIELAKMLALLLCGAAVRLSWQPAGSLVQGFFLGNVLPMMAAVGQLYQDSPTRLCNAYLLGDQVRLGQVLVGIAVAVGLAWMTQLMVALMRRDAAAALPPDAGAVTAGSAAPGSR
jgi:hypothetical protein